MWLSLASSNQILEKFRDARDIAKSEENRIREAGFDDSAACELVNSINAQINSLKQKIKVNHGQTSFPRGESL